MPAITARTDCASRETLRDLLEERVDDGLRPALEAHLEHCAACATTFSELAAQWSLATLAGARAAEGPATRAIRERLAAAAPPPAPPCIPGIADLVLAGSGGMGVVYRGRDERLGRSVAVKVLAAAGPLSHTARARAEREARVLARLDHPHIVRVYAAGAADGLPYIVMEWIEGRSLQQRIAAGAVPPREAARIGLDLARALAEVHAVDIIHRDIKPDNVLLAAAADGAAIPKLVDFGLARPDDAGRSLTRATAVLGTPAYMAPEQTGLEPTLGPVTVATDIHALGGVLYCMLTGRAPYEADTSGGALRRAARADAVPLATAAPRVPHDLRTIVETCLRYEPAARYRSAGHLADDLARFLEHRPIMARPAGPATRLRSWIRRRPAAAVAIGLAAAMALGVAGGTAYHVARLAAARAEMQTSRDAAVTARDAARQALMRLTDGSVEAMLKRGPALDDMDRDYLRAVRDEFARWPLEPDAEAGFAVRADGLRRVAELFSQVNRLEDALASHEALLATLDEWIARHGPRDDLLDRRLESSSHVRRLLHQLGRYAESGTVARRDAARIEATGLELPVRRMQFAAALVDQGIALNAMGMNDAALPLVDRGLDLATAAERDAPANAAILGERVRMLYNAALLSDRAGRVDERRERLEALVRECERGLVEWPAERAAWDRGLLLGLASLIDAELRAARPSDALAFAERRRAAARAAFEREPGNLLFLGEVVHAALQVFACHQALGRPAESRADLLAAVGLAESAVQREPAVLDRSRLLVMALSEQARMHELVGEPESAIAALDRLVTVLMPWRHDTAVAELIAGRSGEAARLLESVGNPAAALARLDAALAVAPQSMRSRLVERRDALLAAGHEPPP